MSIRAVVFDIGGVLALTPDTGWRTRWAARAGLSAAELDARLADVWARGAIGQITEAEANHEVGRRLGLDAQACDALWDDAWAEYLGQPNAELLALARSLRGRYRLGILSNSFVGARERERTLYDFEAGFDAIVYSHEVGMEKPDPRVYALVCRRLGVQPRQTLFVDDLVENVRAAQQLGMQAVHFVDRSGGLREIEARLSSARGL